MQFEGLMTCSQEPATGPALSRVNPVDTLPPCFPNIGFNIIINSTPVFQMFPSFTLSSPNFVRISHLPHPRYMPCPSHPPSFDHPNNIW
jgi:hypothetical protein